MEFSPAKLRQAREAQGMKQADLCWAIRRVNPKLRPDPAAISGYETGKHIPQPNMLAAIAKALGHPIEFFYESGGDDDEEEEAALRAALPLVSDVSLSKAMHARVEELASRARIEALS